MPGSAPGDVSVSRRVSGRTPEARQCWPFGPSLFQQSHQGPRLRVSHGAHLSVLGAQHFRTCGSHLGFPKASPAQVVHTFHSQPAVIIISISGNIVAMQLFNYVPALLKCISPLPRRRYLKRYTYCTPQRIGTHSGYRKHSLGGYLDIRLS